MNPGSPETLVTSRAPRLDVATASLFLDLDGTLAPFVDNPDDVVVEPEGLAVLSRANEALAGRVAILSGRTIESVDAILTRAVTCVAGVHGLQRRTAAAEVHSWDAHPELGAATEAAENFARTRRGLRVERKGLSVALHYRTAPEAEAEVKSHITKLADATGLTVQLGDHVAELRTPGPDKGAALRAFMQEAPFANSTPLFIGDDLTDEAGFVAARDFGGTGVLVGPDRETAALGRLRDPQAVFSWIDRSIAAGAFDLGEAECLD